MSYDMKRTPLPTVRCSVCEKCRHYIASQTVPKWGFCTVLGELTPRKEDACQYWAGPLPAPAQEEKR